MSSALAYITVVSILYIPILVLIFYFRNKQAIHFKSPLMIILGGFCLYSDSVIIILNMSKLFKVNNYFGKCALSVSTTILFHFTAYFCIIFRAIRIFTVMNLEKRYLDKIYKLGEMDRISISSEKESSVDSSSLPIKGFGIFT